MTDREFLIRRALLGALLDSKPYVVLGDHLRSQASATVPRLNTTEFDTALAAIEDNRLAVSVEQDRGTSYTITPAGEAWLLANR